jgi:hypothetical protein
VVSVAALSASGGARGAVLGNKSVDTVGCARAQAASLGDSVRKDIGGTARSASRLSLSWPLQLSRCLTVMVMTASCFRLTCRMREAQERGDCSGQLDVHTRMLCIGNGVDTPRHSETAVPDGWPARVGGDSSVSPGKGERQRAPTAEAAW